MSALIQDLRYTLRTLRKAWGFALFAIAIGGLGIGAATSVFSVLDAVLLRPLPFAQPQHLVWIVNHQGSGLSAQTTQVGHMLDLRERTRTLSAVAGYMAFYGVGDTILSGRGEPERLNAVPVSENFFPVLGVQPEIGRSFTPDEAKINGPKAVIISHGLWTRRLASDPHVVGSALTLNDEAVTVVGVLPASFDFGSVFAPGSHFDLYVPFPLTEETNRWGNTMALIGRLKAGVTASQSQAETRTIAAELTREHPNRNSFEGFVTPLADQVNARIRPALWLLGASVAAVMLIVCANLSNLLLARTASRRKEMAVRIALGAGRRRLLAQMLTEGLVLAAGGALVGVAIAFASTRALAHLDAVNVPLLASVHVDAASLLFTLALTLATGIVFGLSPALGSREPALHDALKDASRGSTGGGTWVRSALVVSEVAFACVLLVGAGLLMRSFARVLDVDLGFRPSNAITVRVDPGSAYSTAEKRTAYFDEVLRLARGVTGVEAAGITDALPLGKNRTWGARAKGVTYERGKSPFAFPRMVSDGYMAAMGIPVKAGRDIAPEDTAASDPVIVVNQTMADRLWPGQDPIGKFVLGPCAKERRVVGVVGDVRHLALEQASGNEMYIPLRQCGDQPSSDLVVRSTLTDGTAARSLREALKAITPSVTTNEIRPLQQLVDRSVSPRRFTVTLLAAFAVFALILASLGIYAVISYSVNQRTQEIGIRMALGASAAGVRAHIVGQTMKMALAGIAIGVVASWLLGRALTGLLYGVTATDPFTFAIALGVLAGVAALAGYVPARRASQIDPLVSLRAQ